MVTEQELRNFSLFLSILGLIGVVVVAYFTTPMEVRLEDVTEDLLGKYVMVRGEIKRMRWSDEGHVFLTIGNENARLKIVIFASTASKLKELKELESGDKVLVKGRVSEYRGEIELVAENIKRLNSP